MMANSVTAFAARKLREDETRTLTHVVRASVAGLILLFTMAFVASASQNDSPGQGLLSTVVWVNVIAVIVTSLTFFTPVLADEREQGTLALLKLTADGDGAVLAGLVLPRLSFALVLLAVQIPFVLLAVTLGGVTVRQVFGCYFALCTSTTLLCAVATCAATLTRSAGSATAMLIGYVVILTIVSAILDGTGVVDSEVALAMLAALPMGEASAWLDGPTRQFFGPYFVSAAVQFLLAAGIAAVAFKRVDATADHRGTGIATRIRQYAARHRSFAPKNLNGGPHAWKDYHLVVGGHVGMLLRVVGYLVIPTAVALIMFLNTNTRSYPGNLSMALAIFASSLGQITFWALPIECAWLAARRIRLEIDDDAWQMLELLPTSRQHILSGKGSGALRGLLPGLGMAVLAMLIAGFLAGYDGWFVSVIGLGLVGGIVMSAMLVATWFLASHLALRFKTGPATGVAVLLLIVSPFVIILPAFILGEIGLILLLLAIPAALGLLVYGITSFSNRFYKRALRGSD